MPSGVWKSPSALLRAAGVQTAPKELVAAWCDFFCLFLVQELAPVGPFSLLMDAAASWAGVCVGRVRGVDWKGLIQVVLH